MTVDGHGDHPLGQGLSHDELIQKLLQLSGLHREKRRRRLLRLLLSLLPHRGLVPFQGRHLPFFVLQEDGAELHALVADPGSMTGDQAIDLALGLPAERAVNILPFKSASVDPVQSETTSKKRIKGTAESIPLKRLIFMV